MTGICDTLRRKRKKHPKPPPKPPVPKPPVPSPGDPPVVVNPNPIPNPPPTPTPTPGPPVVIPPVVKATKIQIVNRSTVVRDADGQAYTSALLKQIAQFLDPATGWPQSGPYTLGFVPAGKLTDLKAWQVLLLDDSDQAGALGYHDVTPAGLPLGKVFAKTDIQYGESVSVTASHELLEMIGDPNINQVVDAPNGDTYILENCDAVQGDTYTIDGVKLSDFVFRSWFGTGKQRVGAGTKMDYLGRLTKPFTLSKGGYISIDRHDGTGWTQIFGQLGAAGHGYAARPKVGSRRERRSIPRDEWIRSAS